MKLIIIALLAFATFAEAQVAPPQRGTIPRQSVIANRVEIPASAAFDDNAAQSSDPFLLRFATEDGAVTVAQFSDDGTLQLNFGATIDFSPALRATVPGIAAGYIIIRIGGRPMMIPVYELPARWHTEGSQP